MTTDQKVTGLNPVGVTKTICVNGAARQAAPFFILLRCAMRQFVDFQLV